MMTCNYCNLPISNEESVTEILDSVAETGKSYYPNSIEAISRIAILHKGCFVNYCHYVWLSTGVED